MTTQDTNEAALWICLQQIPGLGGQGICKLLRQFGNPENIFAASRSRMDCCRSAGRRVLRSGPIGASTCADRQAPRPVWTAA